MATTLDHFGRTIDVSCATAEGLEASSATNAVLLRNQLTAEEIAGGHAFEKHVIQQAEFPGVTTRSEFASQIEKFLNSPENGHAKSLEWSKRLLERIDGSGADPQSCRCGRWHFLSANKRNRLLLGAAMKRYACPCCGKLTLKCEPPGSYDLCPVCYWEDDGVQFADPEYKGGANRESLNAARVNYAAFGASSKSALSHVRRPLPDEEPSAR